MRKQAGFTLIELMIAGVISAFVLIGLINFFVVTNKSITLSDSLSQNQETGRFAMNYITKFIRLAGYSHNFQTTSMPLYIENLNPSELVTCTGNQTLACSSNNPITPVDPNDDGNILGDRLSIPFSVGSNISDQIRSCTGTILGGPINGEQSVSNVFWVSNTPDNQRQLRCRTFDRVANNWLDAPVSIINNVERFEFQIGIAAAKSDKHASRYMNLESFQNDPEIDLNFVRSIRIAVLTTSLDSSNEDKLQSNIRVRDYTLLDAPTLTYEDSNLRNIFINTIELPNMMERAPLQGGS